MFCLGRSFRCLELSGWRCWEGSRYTQTTTGLAEESSWETSGCLQIVTEAVGVDVKSSECRELEARRRGSPAAEERQAHLVAGMNVWLKRASPRAPREHPSAHPHAASLVSLHPTESLNDVSVLLCLTDAPTKPH